MLTRCPTCATMFRVTPDQLKARQGQVRCGQCLAEFSALETLVDDLMQAAPPAKPLPELAAAPSAIEPQGIWESVRAPLPDARLRSHAQPEAEPNSQPDTTSIPREASIAAEQPGVETLPISGRHDTDAPLAAPESLIEPPAATTFRRAEHPNRDAEPYAEEPFLQERDPPRRWPWVLASIVASLLLAAQAALHFRTDLAAKMPKSRPILAATCEMIGCQLALPTDIAQIGIETSDLHPDTQAAGHLQLVATLRNRAAYAQTWPNLELTLTDSGDRALVRRAIAPSEYLPAKIVGEDGFRANSEQSVQLELQAPGVPAVGYRLYVFYP